ncbi:general substrate transporter [Xylogone sp. PMI_703]|nr:general substrate transporter [Xylogone sp. PMI_703]
MEPFLGLKGNKLLAAVTISAGMGFILFGYDNGVMGSVLGSPSFEQQFHLSSTISGTVTAMFELGCVIGAWSVSLFGEPWGRRPVIHMGSFCICIGAAIQTSSYSTAQLIVGRIVEGIGMGFITSTVPVWQAETSPPSIRGAMICSSLSFVLLGQVNQYLFPIKNFHLIAYWSEYGTSRYNSSFSWRFPFALQALLAIIVSCLLFFMPESPRWLFSHDQDEKAIQVLRCLRGSSDEQTADTEAEEIRAAIVFENSVQRGWFDLFREDNVRSRWRVILAIGIQSMQPFSGSAVISYYQTVIFQDSIGMGRNQAQLMSGYLSIWFLAASFLTWFLIERVGRRPLFLIFCICMAVAMSIIAAMVEVNSHASGIIAATAIFLYEGFFTWGWMGNLWCYTAEILPLDCRSKGMGFAVGFQWVWNFVMIFVTPIGLTNIGWRMYIVFTIFNLAFFPVIYIFFPETAGMSLELLDAVFIDKSANPVKKAAEFRKRLKRGEEVNLRHEFEDALGGNEKVHSVIAEDDSKY